MQTAPMSESTEFDAAGLIVKHQAGIWRYLRALGCSPAEADDLTQETFLAVLRRPFQEFSEASTNAYLRQVAYHQFVSAHRRSGRVIAVENIEAFDQVWERWSGSSQHDDSEDLLAALRECLQELTERARFALERRFKDRESRGNIASALGISEHGARNLMQRAKQQLRLCVEKKRAGNEEQ
jgi:RNA polymerase sigma-70 factor (ECF subfamily)